MAKNKKANFGWNEAIQKLNSEHSASIEQNGMLGEVPTGNGAGGYEVIGSATNVITHLNSLIHDMAFGANQSICRVDFESAVEAFERLKRHFA